MKREEHKITLIAEFKPGIESEKAISNLSLFVSNIINPRDTILTELQSFPKGYRIKYDIMYYTNFFSKRTYLKELSNLSDWLCKDKDCNGTISAYHYNYV